MVGHCFIALEASSAMALEFFDRLPKKLTPVEETLRTHLREAARAAAQLLPPGNVVSLQEWVECRMPGEVELGTDDAGLAIGYSPDSRAIGVLASKWMNCPLPLGAAAWVEWESYD
eukprot:Skav218871  [mRNA]  locus=scaffold843:78268:87978:- [translate_table: standard]